MTIYSAILQGSEATEDNAYNFARHLDFSDCKKEYYKGTHNTYIDTVKGIDIYYQYGADYYFFADSLDN